MKKVVVAFAVVFLASFAPIHADGPCTFSEYTSCLIQCDEAARNYPGTCAGMVSACWDTTGQSFCQCSVICISPGQGPGHPPVKTLQVTDPQQTSVEHHAPIRPEFR